MWEVSKFGDNLVLYNQIKAPETSESITKIAKESEVISTVSREIKVYTEEYHLNQVPDEIREFIRKIEFNETRNYVKKVVKKYFAYSNRSRKIRLVNLNPDRAASID